MSDPDRYRLAPVRDLRARDEQVRRGELAAAVGDARATAGQLDEAARRVEIARTEVAAARAVERELITRGTTPAVLGLAERFTARKRRELDALLDAHLRTRARHRGQLELVDAAQRQLARTRAAKELVERHFARWRAERAKLADRRED